LTEDDLLEEALRLSKLEAEKPRQMSEEDRLLEEAIAASKQEASL
jgi:hypothetical protein